MQSAAIVQRLWNHCNVLRDGGVSCGESVEQLAYLRFLKMAGEQVRELGRERVIPEGMGWQRQPRRRSRARAAGSPGPGRSRCWWW